MKHLDFSELTIGDINNLIGKARQNNAENGVANNNINALAGLILLFKTYAESKVKNGQEYEADFGKSKYFGPLIYIRGKKGQANLDGVEFDGELTTIGFTTTELISTCSAFAA